MTNVQEATELLDCAIRPIETPETSAELTEAQAIAALDDIVGERPSIRVLAVQWNWHKSRVERLLKKLDSSAQHKKPTATEFRRTLINAGEEFERRFPSESVEENVDRMIAERKVDYNTAGIMRMRNDRQAAADRAGEANQEMTLLPPRQEITIQHDIEMGRWIIKQRNWPDDDEEIWLSDEDIHEFVDVLTDHLGYGKMRP